MERTKKATEAAEETTNKAAEIPMVTFKNLGSSPYPLTPERNIKPGETFQAPLEAVPELFRDIIKPLTPIANMPVKIVNKVYTLEPDEDKPGFYFIVDDKDKRVSENSLEKKEATALIKSLS